MEFIARNGHQKPIASLDELHVLKTRGEIGPDTLMRAFHDGPWVRAESFPFFAARPSEPAPLPAEAPVVSDARLQAVASTSPEAQTTAVPPQPLSPPLEGAPRQSAQGPPVPSSALILLRERAQKARRLSFWSAGLLGGGGTCALILALMQLQWLEQAVIRYQRGSTMLEAFKDPIITLPLQLLLGGVLFAAAVCFLILFTQPNTALSEIETRNQRWEGTWTGLAMLFPLLNLYRPWAGLAEAEGVFKTYSKEEARKLSWPPFSLPGRGHFAIPYGVALIGGGVLNRVVMAMADIPATGVLSFQQFLEYRDAQFRACVVSFIVLIAFLATHLHFWNQLTRWMDLTADQAAARGS